MNLNKVVKTTINDAFWSVRYKHEPGRHNQKTHGRRGAQAEGGEESNDYRDKTIASMVAPYNNRPEQDVELAIKVYTPDGKLDLGKSYRTSTKAKNLSAILTKNMDILAQREEKSHNVYVMQDYEIRNGVRIETHRPTETLVRRDMLAGGTVSAPSPKAPTPQKPVADSGKVDLGPPPKMEKKLADKIFATHEMFKKYQKTPDAKVTTTFTDKKTGAKFQEKTTARKAAMSLQRRKQLELILAIGWAALSMARRKMIAQRYGKLGKWMLAQAKKKGRR